jgi:uroporphyrinogen-III synthase
MKAKHRVLSTKRLEPSLVERASLDGIEIVEQDAISVKPILTREKWDEIFSLLQKDIRHAVFTSSNAVTALKKYLNSYVNHLPPNWKIFCISGKTAEALQQDQELFGVIEATSPYATELAQHIIQAGVTEVLFFSGNIRRDTLPTILHQHGVEVHEVVVYTTEETPQKAGGEWEAVLFFSPSAVQSFFSVNQLNENTVCFAIGHTTAGSLEAFTTNFVYVSDEPTQESLLEKVKQYFQNTVGSD